jgi:hypothetical protein
MYPYESIIHGLPSAGGSHFRMVLPMAWRSCKTVEPNDRVAQRWRKSAATEDHQIISRRRNYFTQETASLLLDEALWIEPENLSGWPLNIQVSHESKVTSTGVLISAPSLVLFEARADREKKIDSPLHVAFMLMDVSFPNGVSINNFLTISEVLRYWEEPFEGLYEERKIEIHEGGNQSLKHYSIIWQSAFALAKHITFENRHFEVSTPDVANFPLKSFYADNRAFVCSFCRFVKNPAEGTTGKGCLENAIDHSLASDWTSHTVEIAPWIKLLNVDHHQPKAPFKASAFEAEWAKQRTYLRWAHCGTLHGFTTHSYAWLYTNGTSEEWNQKLASDFRTHYTDLTLYSYYLRQVLMRFNARLFLITKNLHHHTSDEKLLSEARKHYGQLREQYLVFENLYRFPLLSTQQLPLEMYEIQQRELDVDVLYQEMSQQIQNSDEFFAAKIAASQAESLEKINYLVILSTAVSIVSAVAALAALRENQISCIACVGLLIALILTIAAYHTKNFKNDL